MVKLAAEVLSHRDCDFPRPHVIGISSQDMAGQIHVHRMTSLGQKPEDLVA